MWRNILNIFSRQGITGKRGFGLVEVMVSVVVLGFLYVALLHLQGSNDEAVLRIRGRDGAVQVAQEIMDSLKAVGSAAIPSKASKDTLILLSDRNRKWERGLGGTVTIKYTPRVTVSKTDNYVAETQSGYESVKHVYAKQVNVVVEWSFKGSTQSVNVSGVIR